jgi:XTP/dITP diphosphohydrolase
LFYAKIEAKQMILILQMFAMKFVKLIHRHPHICDTVVKDEEEVKQLGKTKTKKEGSRCWRVFLKAAGSCGIQDKVKGVGFDWEEPHQVWDKVQEELQELQVEVEAGNQDNIEAEFGDVLFL